MSGFRFTAFEARKPPASAERMNRLHAAPCAKLRCFQRDTMCLWHRTTYTTKGRLSCSSITSSGYLADGVRYLSEPSRIGSKRCSARKPESLRLASSIWLSSPTICICSSTRLHLSRSVNSSTGSRATRRGCFGKSSRTFGRCRLCGRQRTLRVRQAECRKPRFRSTSRLKVGEPE